MSPPRCSRLGCQPAPWREFLGRGNRSQLLRRGDAPPIGVADCQTSRISGADSDHESHQARPASFDEAADDNRLRAGDLFFLMLWLQSQMADLLIFATCPHLIGPFLSESAVMPREFVRQRFLMTGKSFTTVKSEFVAQIRNSLMDADTDDLDHVTVVRNALAHSHVALSRPYFLYRPSRGQAQEARILRTLRLQPSPESSDPMVLKLEVTQDRYEEEIARIKRLDEVCFARISTVVDVSHSRIR